MSSNSDRAEETSLVRRQPSYRRYRNVAVTLDLKLCVYTLSDDLPFERCILINVCFLCKLNFS